MAGEPYGCGMGTACYVWIGLKWFSQRPLLSEKQHGDKKNISTYFSCDVLKFLLLVLVLRSGRRNSADNEAWSGGWSLRQNIMLLLKFGRANCILVFHNHHRPLQHYTGHWKSHFTSPLVLNCSTELACNYTVPLFGHFALQINRFSSHINYFQDG